MKLYAEIRSERGKPATKGGQEELRIEIKGEDKLTFLEILILAPEKNHPIKYPIVSILGTTYEVARQIEEDIKEIIENSFKGKQRFTTISTMSGERKVPIDKNGDIIRTCGCLKEICKPCDSGVCDHD